LAIFILLLALLFSIRKILLPPKEEDTSDQKIAKVYPNVTAPRLAARKGRIEDALRPALPFWLKILPFHKLVYAFIFPHFQCFFVLGIYFDSNGIDRDFVLFLNLDPIFFYGTIKAH
jgi:hypothetical protein